MSADGPFPVGLILKEAPSNSEEMEEMARFWNLRITQLGKHRYCGNLSAFHSDRMQVSRVIHRNSSRIDGAIPQGTMILAVPISRRQTMQFHGVQVEDRDLILQDCVHGLDVSYVGELDILSVAVSQQMVRQRLTQLWRQEPRGAMSRTLKFSTLECAAKACLFLCEAIRRTTAKPDILHDHPLRRNLETSILDAILCGLEEPRLREGALARRWLARRAAAVIHERCREDLNIGDLCEAVGASRRTLHLGFLDLYGTSPMKYLLSIRLAGVRRELIQCKRSDAGVTDIATAWGFSHLGRFSASYRQYFGTLPSSDASRKQAAKT